MLRIGEFDRVDRQPDTVGHDANRARQRSLVRSRGERRRAGKADYRNGAGNRQTTAEPTRRPGKRYDDLFRSIHRSCGVDSGDLHRRIDRRGPSHHRRGVNSAHLHRRVDHNGSLDCRRRVDGAHYYGRVDDGRSVGDEQVAESGEFGEARPLRGVGGEEVTEAFQQVVVFEVVVIGCHRYTSLKCSLSRSRARDWAMRTAPGFRSSRVPTSSAVRAPITRRSRISRSSSESMR